MLVSLIKGWSNKPIKIGELPLGWKSADNADRSNVNDNEIGRRLVAMSNMTASQIDPSFQTNDSTRHSHSQPNRSDLRLQRLKDYMILNNA